MPFAAYLIAALPYVLLAVLVFITFANTLNGYFVCDDLMHLDYLFRAFNTDKSLLLAPFYSPWLKDTSFYNFYRPLAEVSFALDYLVYNARATGFHLTSLLWHLANVWMFFGLIKTLANQSAFYIAGARERTTTAFLAAAIWSTYPTHTEAIGWLAARSDLIATFFYFLTLQFFALSQNQHQRSHKVFKYLWALPMVLGFLTKELTVSLPFTIFVLSLFTTASPGRPWTKTIALACRQTFLAFIILIVYVIGRAFAIGDLIGGYSGSIGVALNTSLVNRWLQTQSFFKVLHPFNDQLIGPTSLLRLALRLTWGLCGVMTIIGARVGGAIATKYRFISFAFIWLLLSLAPNLQIWSFSSTMAGGRIAYLPTAPIVLLIVLSVYPLGVSILRDRQALLLKLSGIATLISLTVTFCLISRINNQASIEASNMVRLIGGQMRAIIDTLPDQQKLVVLNLPTQIKGAFAFTSPGMADALLKPPLAESDVSNRLIVLDSQPCSYSLVNFSDVKASVEQKDNFQFYYYDQTLGRLVKIDAAQSSNALARPSRYAAFMQKPLKQTAFPDLRSFEAGGENFRFKIDPAVNPADFEYARFTLTASDECRYEDKQLSARQNANLCYAWNNGPPNDDGEKNAFVGQLVSLPGAGLSKRYLVHLGENKLWLLSNPVSYMQVFWPYFKDPKSQMKLEFLSGDLVAPILKASVSGEGSQSALSFKYLDGKKILTLAFDASKLPGAKKVLIEIMPPYHYFDHYNGRFAAPALNPKHLKLISRSDCRGAILFAADHFPRAATYQIRACAVDQAGQIIGDFSESITVNVLRTHKVQTGIDRE